MREMLRRRGVQYTSGQRKEPLAERFLRKGY
jgi:hypothetical protein